MSNGNNQPQQGTLHTVKEILQLVLLIIGAIGGAAAAIGTLLNYNHGEEVEKKVDQGLVVQEEAKVKTEEVKKTLDDKTVVDEKKAAVDNLAQEINLYASWLYLSNEAEASGLQADKDKAAQAKKLYDAFKAKNPKH